MFLRPIRMNDTTPAASSVKVVLAFAAIYIIWGSTYFFIFEALRGFPPMVLGGLRFITAAVLMFAWCAIRGQHIRPGKDLKGAVIVGVLLLFVGNGMVVWVEQAVPSSVVAIMIATAPLWFVLLDKPNWNVNFRSVPTVLGVLAGFAGVLLLFSGRIAEQRGASGLSPELTGLLLLMVGCIAWSGGSLYAKAHPSSLSPAVNTAWQMATGGVCFLIAATWRGEWATFDVAAVPVGAWLSLAYLMLFGSIVAFSAYVWLLSVRPATQVSTYAYVNPVVAVLLGAYIGHEPVTALEMGGLAVILGSVLLINWAKYRKDRAA
jgi:drug/metabolite transporter (DMT)-like permease